MCPGCLTTETVITLGPLGPKTMLRTLLAALLPDIGGHNSATDGDASPTRTKEPSHDC